MAETAKPNNSPAPAASAAPPPSVLERWLGFAPMLLFFGVLALTTPFNRGMSEFFVQVAVELPLPTKAAMRLSEWMEKGLWFWMPAAVAVSWAYFTFVAKRKRRVLWFSIAATLVLLLFLVFYLGGTVLPFMKIQEALMRR